MLAEPPLLDFLAALKHLIQVFHWHLLVASRFNCRIERVKARETSINDVIATWVPAEERHLWEHAFEGYCHAWAATWRFVERYECTPIPAEYKELQITRQTNLAFLIADDKDEGLCP